MNLKKLIFLYCFVVCIAEVSAMQTIIKDTSYSVKSSFLKYKNEFSSLKIIQQKNSKNVLEKNTITYKILPNRNLVLDAFINSKHNNTAVIILHGGGWKSGDKSHIKPLAQYIASKGYSCFAIEYRLSDEAKYPESIYDVKDAIKYIKQQAKVFHVDTTKIAILGASSGAQIATLIGTTNNNPKFEVDSKYKTSSTVQAIVNLDGILAFKHPESKEGKMASLWLGGTYEEIPEVWAEASALTHTDKNTPPILFINSQYERFHAGRDDMIKILNKHYIYSQVKTIPNSPHTFWLFHPYFNDTVNYITQFLDRTFKDN